MNIGFISTRLAGVDGVSLETAKLVSVLEEMGHDCFYCAGELGDDAKPGHLVPEMHFFDPTARAIYEEVFTNPAPGPEVYRQIYARADMIREKLEAFIDAYKIDVLVPQNASCIPLQIPLGIAIEETIKRRRIKTLFHHHDFYWEREHFINNGIQDILDSAFPPRLETAHHMVISTVMQRRLKAWRGIEAVFLPNVFDFENPPPAPDAYALSFREAIGLSDDDLIVLQPTRVIRRKAIEKSIELMRKLNDPRLILIITGYEYDEPTQYGSWLREEADRAGIRYQFIGAQVGDVRGEANGQRVFTLWDIYPHAHFITYPSVYEGFGNALIETLYFRKPLVVHRYPVYVADIQSCGVKAVEFYHDLTNEVITQTRQLIDDPKLRQEMIDHNYEVGLRHFSFQVLRTTLQKALYNLTHD